MNHFKNECFGNMGQVDEADVRQELLSSKSTFGSELNRAKQNITTIGQATSETSLSEISTGKMGKRNVDGKSQHIL